MTASEKLRALDAAMTPRPWDFDWNAPQNLLASDGSGKHVGNVGRFPNDGKEIVALRNALPLIADVVEAAERVDRLFLGGAPPPPEDAGFALGKARVALTALQEHLGGDK